MATHVLAPPRREMATEDLVAAFGPEHIDLPGLRLILTLDGEQVSAADVELGYRHRGLEKLAERDWPTAARAAALVDPLAPLAVSTAWARAVETLAGIAPPLRAARLRLIALEIERAANHVYWLGRLGALLDLPRTERPAGEASRGLARAAALVHAGDPGRFVVPGGVAADLPDDAAAGLPAELDPIRRALEALDHTLGGDRLARRRLDGLAPIAAERAVALGARGPVLRACGVARDVREDDNLYRKLDFAPVQQSGGDALARYAVRVTEAAQALDLVERATAGLSAPMEDMWSASKARRPHPNPLPEGDGTGRDPGGDAQTVWKHLVPGPVAAGGWDGSAAGEAVASVEGPRGALAVWLVAGGDGGPVRVAVRGPSLVHAMLLPEILPGCLYADVPLAVASLDLSIEEAER